MNDLIPNCSLKGTVLFDGTNIYDKRVDPVEVRRRIGMVFQQPNPFPKSIYENIAFGARINGFTGDMDELVESSLRKAALWDECKDKLNDSGYSLSGGQQQRLCIARASGETAPLIFTALFSYYYVTGFGDLFYEMGSLAVLIYNFALEPYDAQNKLAWAASFILVLSILSVNIFSRILAAFTEKTKRV